MLNNWIGPTSIRVGLIAAVMCALSGCGQGSSKPTARLTGTVTINGQPLPADAQATIMFRPNAKGLAKSAGVPIENGKYDSPNTPVGDVTVYFSIQQPTGKMISDAGGPLFAELRTITPEAAAKGIQLSVTGDNDSQNFDLQ